MTSSYTYTHTVETDLTPEAIWALYEDVSTWPSWDADAELITRDGPFEAGLITADFPEAMASLIAVAKERSS